MATHSNYWFSTTPTRQTIASGLVRNADVLIIGGGIAGISLLYHLVSAGITNTYLVEEATVGFHASGRSSGQLMLRGSKLFHEFGEDVGAEYLKFIAENNKRFLRGIRNAQLDVDLRDNGGLRLAVDQEEFDKLKIESDFIAKHIGLRCPILSPQDVLSLLPDSNFVGGMFVPTEATFNPYKTVNGLRDFIEHKGYRVMTNCQVDKVIRNENGFSVSIRHKGTIRAKKVVYCTNAYTSELLPELSDFMTPCRGQMLATDYLNDCSLPIMSMTSNNCNEYWRLYNDRLLVGGMRHSVRGNQTGHTNDGETSASVFDNLRQFVAETLPFLGKVNFTHTWSGIMAMTKDGLPLIGEVPGKPGEYVLAGFNGYGFGHAVHGSMILKDIIKNGQSTRVGAQLFNPGRV